MQSPKRQKLEAVVLTRFESLRWPQLKADNALLSELAQALTHNLAAGWPKWALHCGAEPSCPVCRRLADWLLKPELQALMLGVRSKVLFPELLDRLDHLYRLFEDHSGQ